MLNLLGCLFFFLFGLLLIVLAPLLHILNNLFGRRRQVRPPYSEAPENDRTGKSSPNAEKIFTQEEGEYIDFEDIPDKPSQKN